MYQVITSVFARQCCIDINQTYHPYN